MKIYLDVCCLNRPFDDQTQDRINLESEAVLSILYRCQIKEWQLVGSEAIDYEVYKIQDVYRKEKILQFMNLIDEKIRIDNKIKNRDLELMNCGIRSLDGLHIACAEKVKADIFLSTDDNLIRKAKQNKEIKVKVDNPVMWLMEVIGNECES